MAHPRQSPIRPRPSRPPSRTWPLIPMLLRRGQTLWWTAIVLVIVALAGEAVVTTASCRPAVVLASAEADTTKKEQVPKKKTKTKKPMTEQSEEKEKEKDDDWDCLGGCLGSFFASSESEKVTSDTGDEIVTPPGAASQALAPAGTAPESPRSLPYEATVLPENPHSTDLGLWPEAGGREQNEEVTARLSVQEHVSVTERWTDQHDTWVKIVSSTDPAVIGWVREGDLSPAGEGPPAPSGTVPEAAPFESVPGAAPSEPVIAIGPPRAELGVSFAWPTSTEGSLNTEYGHATYYEVGADGRIFLGGPWNLQMGVAYLHAGGEPQFDYVIGSITESPSNSLVEVWRIDLGGGMNVYFPGEIGFFAWGAGPSLFRVREKADIRVVDGNKQVIDTRGEELVAWKLGGQARVGGGAVLGDRFSLEGHVRLAVFPWSSEEKKSLTLDFVDSSAIGVLTVAVGVSYRFL